MYDRQRVELVGRDRELAVVRGALQRLASGAGGTVVVDGAAGIGKSRLLAELMAAAGDAQISVRHCAAYEFEVAPALAPLVRALGDPLIPARSEASASRSLLAGSASSEAQFAATEACLAAIESLARASPVCLIVDDAQWADVATLAALRVLARRSDELPVLLCVAARAWPRPVALGALVEEAVAHGAPYLRLEPLDDDAVARLLREVGGADASANLRDHARTAGGNPFLLFELLAALTEEGRLDERSDTAVPASVRDTVLRRLAAMPDETLAILQIAAVLGARFDVGDLALALHRPVSELVVPLDHCRRAGVMHDDGTGLDFAHDLVREAIYDDLPADVRRALHTEIARSLTASGASLVRAARHLSRGALPRDAATVSTLVAAARAVGASDPMMALGLAERATEIAGPDGSTLDDLDVELALALARVGRTADSEVVARRALERDLDPSVEVQLRGAIAHALVLQGDPHDRAALELETAAARAELAPLERAMLIADAATARLMRGDFAAARTTATRALELGEQLGSTSVIAQAHGTLAWVASFAGELESALLHSEQAMGAFATPATVNRSRDTPEMFRGMTLVDADRFDEAKAVFTAGRAAAEHGNGAWALPFLQLGLGNTAYLGGDWDTASAELEAAVALADDIGTALGIAFARAQLSLIAFGRGDLTRARTELEIAEALLASGTPPLGIEYVLIAKSSLAEADGDGVSALAILASAWDVDVALGIANDRRSLGPDLVRLALAHGDHERADAVVDQLTRDAEHMRLPSTVAAARRARGMVDDDADELLAAVDAARESPRRLDLAAALGDAALAAADAGRHDAAVTLLDEALGHWESIGALRMSARLLADARARGVRARRRATRTRPKLGWEALSPTEHEVVRLVSGGLTNREVGEQLFISHRTVETHVKHVFEKVGVTSRLELATVALRRSEPPAS